MKELQRLVKAINSYSHLNYPLINLQDETTLEAKLFNLLRNETVGSDEEVAAKLYGDEKLTGSFRMLKSRFRKKLHNHLHFLQLDDDKFSRFSIATQQCMALLQEGHSLIILSEHRMAEKTFDQVLEVAEKYELIDYVVKALEFKQIIATNLGNLQKYRKQDEMLLNAIDKRSHQQKALRTYQLLMVQHKNNVQVRRNNVQHYPSLLEELRGSWEKTGLSSIYSYYHILRVQYLEFKGEFGNIYEAVKETEILFTSGELNEAWYNNKFNIFIGVYALLQTKKYAEGLQFASENKRQFIPYSSNWFSFMENYVLLAIHSKNYKHAGELLCEAADNEHLQKLGAINIERWELYRRYICFILLHFEHDLKLQLPSEFTSELLILPKDKSGFNLALLVLDVLEKLTDRQTDDLQVQAERVRKYIQKYLKGEKAERPRLFMRLLLLALTKLSAAEAREQGRKLLEKLKVTPLPGDAFTEVEIVPYEHLWDYTLATLEMYHK